MNMESEKIAAIKYDKNTLSLAIFSLNKILIGKKMADNNQYNLLLSLLYKFEINQAVLSTCSNLNLFRYIKSQDIKVSLFEKKYFCPRKKQNSEYSYDSLNALIKYLEEKVIYRSLGQIEYENMDNLWNFIGKIDKYNIFEYYFDDKMYIDQQTIKDLNLFHNKNHPNVTINSKKNTSSLLNLIDFTKTTFGFDVLKSWILFPLKNEKDIYERHKMIDVVSLYSKELIPILKKIKSPIKDSILMVKMFPDFLKNSLKVISILSGTLVSFNSEAKIFEDLLKYVDVFENDEVCKGVSGELDDLYDIYDDLPVYLTKFSKLISNKYNMKADIVYFPLIGYLIETDMNSLCSINKAEEVNCLDLKNIHIEGITSYSQKYDNSFEKNIYSSGNPFKCNTDNRIVKAKDITNGESLNSTLKVIPNRSKKVFLTNLEKKWAKKVSRINQDSKLSYLTTNGDTRTANFNDSSFKDCKFKIKDKIYMKDENMKLLDDEIGDVNTAIQNLQEEIIDGARKRILEHNIDILYDYIGFIDALISLSEYSKTSDVCRPYFVKERCIEIENFKDKCLKIELRENVIYSGGSNILELIGQVVILAHIGSYIPSRKVKINIFDKVFSSIKIEESLSRCSSYFLSFLQNISKITQYATKDSLCLMHEVGFGTNYFEGISLFYGIHDYLAHSFVISTTNYEEILNPHKIVSVNSIARGEETHSDYIFLGTASSMSKNLSIGAKNLDSCMKIKYNDKNCYVQKANDNSTCDKSADIVIKTSTESFDDIFESNEDENCDLSPFNEEYKNITLKEKTFAYSKEKQPNFNDNTSSKFKIYNSKHYSETSNIEIEPVKADFQPKYDTPNQCEHQTKMYKSLNSNFAFQARNISMHNAETPGQIEEVDLHNENERKYCLCNKYKMMIEHIKGKNIRLLPFDANIYEYNLFQEEIPETEFFKLFRDNCQKFRNGEIEVEKENKKWAIKIINEYLHNNDNKKNM